MTAPPLQLPGQVVQNLFADAATAAVELADAVALALRTALSERARASLLVSGGRSPIAFFQALSKEPLEWNRVVVSLADERWVGPTHADSNARLVAEHLLQNAAAAATWVPLKSDADTPEAGLDASEQALAVLPLPIDVLVLGVGDDGHTASLFPCADETPQALSAPRLLAAIHPRMAPHARITLTLPALLAARNTFVSIAGASKRQVLEQAVVAKPPLPSGLVLLHSQNPVQVFWSP